jgi:hypothetical protein
MDNIIFVYNADSGLFNGVKDLIHKNISPATYPCSLCAVTYGNLGMRHEWRQFVRSLNRIVEFLHRDELADQYGIQDIPLPAAFKKGMDRAPELWLTSELINSCKSLDDLQELVLKKLDHIRL